MSLYILSVSTFTALPRQVNDACRAVWRLSLGAWASLRPSRFGGGGALRGLAGLGAVFLWAASAMAQTSGDYTYTVSGSAATITAYSGAGGAVTVPGTLGGIAVTTIGSNAFSFKTTLTSVTLPSGVTSIGDSAFNGCSNLTSVVIPSGVTSIGAFAFSSCERLASITLPNSITTIGIWAFNGCRALTSVTIPSGMNAIADSVFHDCRGLTSITIPSTITMLGQAAFHSCTGLTSVSIPSSLTYISNSAFYNCTSLTSVTLPSSVTNLQAYAFGACAGLTRVFFMGNAPSVAANSFAGVTALGYYQSGTTGWTNPFYGLTMATAGAPTLGSPTSASLAGTTVTLGGNVTSDGGATVTARGVVIALTSANANPRLAGTGVTAVAGTGTTGVFTVSATGLTPGAAYSYAAYATNSSGTSYTTVGTFTTLGEAPTITTQPSATSVTAGTAASFTVVASGTAPLTYVWRKDGTAITGATSATYTISSVATGDAGSYTVVVTNSAGSATSNAATLTVTAAVIAPTITTQPSATSATAGTAASFTVGASGTAPLTYVWRKDGTAITGATSAIYTISAVAAGDAGSYTVVVTNSAGSATSNAAMLTVTAAPTAPTVTTPTTTNIATTTATLGGDVTSDGGAKIDARGVVYALTSDNAAPRLGVIGVTNVSGTGTTGAFTVNVTGLTPNVSYSYTAYATNNSGTSYSTIGTFKTLDSAGADFTYVDTGGGLVITGYRGTSDAVFIPSSIGGVSVTGIGKEAFRNNDSIKSVAIPNSVTSIAPFAFSACRSLQSVILPNQLTSIEEGVFNVCSSLRSITIPDSATSIGVGAFAGCEGLKSVTLPNRLTGIGYGAFFSCLGLTSVTIPAGVTSIGGEAFGGCKGLTRINFLGNAPSAGGDCFRAVTATGYYQSGTMGWTPTYSGLKMLGVAGDYIFTDNGTAVAITGYEGAGGAAMIPSTIGGKPVTSIGNGAFYGLTALTNVTIPSSVTRIGDTAFQGCIGLTNVTLPSKLTELGEGVFAGCEKLSAITIPSGLTALRTSVFLGCTALTTVTIPSTITTIEDGVFFGCTGLKSIYFLGNAPTATALSFKFVTAPGIRLSETTGWTNTFYGLNIYIGLNGLTIKSGPAGATINQGQNATFSVVAEGTGPFTYQWKKDGAVLTGATAATLRLVNVTVAQAGNYSVTVSNTQVTTTSSPAALAVNTPLTLASNPTSRTAAIGDTLAPAFSVTATAAAGVTLTYQWRKDGVNILGANSATLGLTAIKATDFGAYSVTITSPTGTLTSTSAVLTRASDPVVAPVITRDPSSVTINPGSSLILSVAATGSPAPTYQWQFNGANIPGANAATLVLTDVIADQAGTYNVVATNSGGTATSKSATVATSSGFGRQLSLSTRGYVGTGGNILIPGFVIAGNGAKRLLIRAAGPALSELGVAGVLEDPQLAVFKDSTQLDENDNWTADQRKAVAVEFYRSKVGAFPFVDRSKDAALVVSLEPGAYTIQVSGVGNTTGTAIVEVYDLDEADANKSRLANLATRALVQAGAGPLISGFVVQGAVAKAVLIRATGPALAGFGVTGTLAQPKLTLFDDQRTPIIENTGWESSGVSDQIIAASQSVGAFGLTRGTADSVILAVLPPGAYTAQVIGADGGSGVTLVEVYELP